MFICSGAVHLQRCLLEDPKSLNTCYTRVLVGCLAFFCASVESRALKTNIPVRSFSFKRAPDSDPRHLPDLLGGSWVVMSGVISRATIVIMPTPSPLRLAHKPSA